MRILPFRLLQLTSITSLINKCCMERQGGSMEATWIYIYELWVLFVIVYFEPCLCHPSKLAVLLWTDTEFGVCCTYGTHFQTFIGIYFYQTGWSTQQCVIYFIHFIHISEKKNPQKTQISLFLWKQSHNDTSNLGVLEREMRQKLSVSRKLLARCVSISEPKCCWAK